MTVRLTVPVVSLWLLLIDFWSDFANASLTVHPTDAVVLVNHLTYFNCSTSARNIKANYVVWYHYPLNSATRNDVYDEGQIMYEYQDRFRIEASLTLGVFNLVVERPSLTDAGRYECQDGVGQGDKASAELIVLEGNPICESSMHSDGVVGQNSCGLKPDELWMTCHITPFHGNTPPTLEWKKSDDESNSSLPVCERSASCNLTQRGDQIRNGQTFVCQAAKLKEQNRCSTAPVKVKYAMSWTEEITEAKGDVICSSNTSQPCTYKWYNAKNEEVSLDENLHTTVVGEYKCEAQCEMNRSNESCRFIAMRVYIVSPEPVSHALVAFVSIPIICVIALLIIGGFYLYKQDKCPNVFNKPVTDTVDHLLGLSADLSSLPEITGQNMVDTLTVDKYYIDRGTSGAIYGPFRWKTKKCALKQILYSPDKLTNEKHQEIMRLRNRCKELDDPHLVKMFEVWLPAKALYILMEYAEGKSLDKILRPKDASHPILPVQRDVVYNWALQIADGMKCLHDNNLVHRNLKAAHVLVMESPDVSTNLTKTLKIGSYTLAAELDHSTVMSLKGTVAWMAPECIRGELFSRLSDVWSYGVTVWEIVTQDVPYSKVKKETDLVRAAMNKTLELKIPESCPEPLQDLLTKCWNYDVDKRPSFTQICDFLRSQVQYKEIHV